MTESPPASLLKADVLGRVKTSAARREQLLDKFERGVVEIGRIIADEA